MILEKALKKSELVMYGDVLVAGQRTQAHFKRLVNAMRETEAGVLEALDAARQECNIALKKVQELQEEVNRLKAELFQHRLAAAGVSAADRRKVLSPAAPAEAEAVS